MPGEAIVTIKDKQWSCSVASTPVELATGLSGVPSIPSGTGMLFVLGQEQIVTVTAENMLFPLSVIFFGENLQVTEVALMLAPGDWGTTSLPCRYFLEVNAGEADGIEAGDQVDIAFSTPTTSWMAPVVTIAGALMMGVMMAKMGKTMADAVFGKPKEMPVLYGPGGKRLLPGCPKGGGTIKQAENEQAAVVPVEPRRPRPCKEDKLEFLPDSPEFLAYTIEDIGYRDKIDSAFEQAIARAKGGGG